MVKTFKEFPGVGWVEGTGTFIEIIKSKCTGCANCIKVCLADCFKLVEKKVYIVSLEKCMECGACWYVCKQDAIRFSWPIGGTGYKTDWG